MTNGGNAPVTRGALLGDLLGAMTAKPRNRSEWQTRFKAWQNPASETEAEKIATANRGVRAALAQSTFLPTREWDVVSQGSYENNTNVRSDSDIDLCVVLNDEIIFEGGGANTPLALMGLGPSATVDYEKYRDHIFYVLQQHYGVNRVRAGNRAIQIDKEVEGRISIDVVPAFRYRIYGPNSALLGGPDILAEGIALYSRNGRVRNTNFPAQQSVNGTAKNNRTGTRYKKVVRVLKKMRNHIRDNETGSPALYQASAKAASFLIESLVYNCPDSCFGHGEIYDDVVSVLSYISAQLQPRGALAPLMGQDPRGTWVEVNQIKKLFRLDQPWTLDDAFRFSESLKAYMGVS